MFPGTSHSNDLRTSAKDPISPSRGRPDLTSLRGPSKHVFGIKWGHLWMLLFSFLNLFDWPYLYKSNSVFKVSLEHRRISKMELFCEISEWLLSANYFSVRTSSENVDWVLNTPLILSSNVIWHVDRSIAETKIFRLGVSLIRPWYVKKEEWIGKKLYYRKIKYITSNTENCKVYLQYLITFLKILYKSTLNF